MQLAVILAFYTPPFMNKKMLLGEKSERMLEINQNDLKHSIVL